MPTDKSTEKTLPFLVLAALLVPFDLGLGRLDRQRRGPGRRPSRAPGS